MTQLVYSRRHARQPTRYDEGTWSVRHGFVGGVAGAQPLHKGGRLRPTAQNTTLRGDKNTFGPLVQDYESVAAE